MFATGCPLIWVPDWTLNSTSSAISATLKMPPTTSGMIGNSCPGFLAGRFWAVRPFVLVVRFGNVPSARNKIQRSFLVPPAALPCRGWARTHREEEKPLLRGYEILYHLRPAL